MVLSQVHRQGIILPRAHRSNFALGRDPRPGQWSSEAVGAAESLLFTNNGSRGRAAPAFRDFIMRLELASMAVSPLQLKSVFAHFMPDFNGTKERHTFEFPLQVVDILLEDLKLAEDNQSFPICFKAMRSRIDDSVMALVIRLMIIPLI
jgi:hypothetical protein